MRSTIHLEQHRRLDPLGRSQDGMNGFFQLVCPQTGRTLNIFSSDGEGWGHVSVSLHDRRNRCPSWPEMEFVRRQFFEPEECVMQLHPPLSEYENGDSFRSHGRPMTQVLHLWRPIDQEIPRPPRDFV